MKKFSLYILALLTVVLTLSPVVSAQSPNTRTGKTTIPAISQYVEQQAKASHFPGLALGIVKGDQTVSLQAYGNVSPDTQFFLASVSKSFTALAVMQLVDQGKIDVDKPVTTYLPEFKIGDGTESGRITVRHLLNQTSGISTRAGLASLFFTPKTTFAQALQVFEGYPLAAKPGQSFAYSNANYAIAGYIVQRVSGQTYSDFVQQNIFDPLEMTHSKALAEAAKAPGVTPGYLNYFGLKGAYQDSGQIPGSIVPAGGIISSASDMTHYLIVQMNDGVYRGKRVISSASLNLMHTSAVKVDADSAVPDASGYGMGWGIGTLNGSNIISHDGQLHDFQTNMAILPQEHIAVVMLVNEYSPLLNESQAYEGMMQGITTGSFPAIDHSFTRYYIIFDSVVIASLLLMAYMLYRIRRWPAKLAAKVKKRGVWRVGVISIGYEFVLALALALGVTYGLGTMYQIIPFTPSLLMGSVPDMSLWIFVMIGFFLVRGVAKVVIVGRIHSQISPLRTVN